MLRVALDLAHLRQTEAGTARVARSLSAALADRDDVELIAIGAGPLARRGSAGQRALALWQDLVWYPALGRRNARRRRADVYHLVLPRGPLRPGRPPTTVTVHDLLALQAPETMSRWNRTYSRRTLAPVLRAADRVVASTEHAAGELERRLGIDRGRVRVVPLGVDRRFAGPASSSPVAGAYVLFVGTPEPRKNLARLADATRSVGLPLVVAGAGGWGDGRPADPSIRWLGAVSDDDLVGLYAGAACLAIPSLYEGFGLPALEAMAAGCPVVAGRAGALPEVCGDAAVLVDPLQPGDIAAGIARAVAEADDLRLRGRANAARFSWDATAAALVEVWRELS